MSHSPEFDVFEHGIVVTSGEPPTEVVRLATTRQPIYSGYTLAVVDRDGSSLNHRAVHLAEVPVAHRISDFHDERDVRYCLLSVLYHLNRIIDLYVDKCRLFEEYHPVGPSSGNIADPRIYYEVDAFWPVPGASTRRSRRCFGSILRSREGCATGGRRFARPSSRM